MIHMIPNTFIEVLQLAIVIVLTITALSELIAVIAARGHGLLNMGLQLAALAAALHISRDWVYGLAFQNIFSSQAHFSEVMLTISMVATGFGVDQLVRYFIWEGHFSRVHQIKAPGLLVGIVRVTIYVICVLSVLQFVYGQTITALATLSGALAVVLGLSAQTTLGEMFAGIAIAVSRPFHIGDWVKIGDLEEGEVIDQTWRTVRIRTRDKTVMNITNRIVAERPVKNFSHQLHGVRQSELIAVSNVLEPAVVEAVLIKALMASGLVLADPGPNVLFKRVYEGLSEFGVSYSIANYAERVIIADKIWKIIHATLRDNKIAFGLAERRLEVINSK